MYWLSKQGEVITDQQRNQGKEGPIFTYPWTHPVKDIEEKLKISPKDSRLNRQGSRRTRLPHPSSQPHDTAHPTMSCSIYSPVA